MEFLTLHELSLRLDVSVRILRHRLKQLLTQNRLVEGRDCRRENYVDETHFVWLVDPIVFSRVTGLPLVTKVGNQATESVTQPATQPSPVVYQPADTGDKTLPKVDSKPPGMEREMIDLLKDQVRVKDVQIADLSDQNKKLNDLNFRLNGQLVQHSDRIQTLLQLTGGKIDFQEPVAKSGNQPSAPGNQSVHTAVNHASGFGNQSSKQEGQQGRGRAAA